MTRAHTKVMLEQAYRAGWMDAAAKNQRAYAVLEAENVERILNIWSAQVADAERHAVEAERLAAENKRLEGAAVQMSRAARSLEKKLERLVVENMALRKHQTT